MPQTFDVRHLGAFFQRFTIFVHRNIKRFLDFARNDKELTTKRTKDTKNFCRGFAVRSAAIRSKKPLLRRAQREGYSFCAPAMRYICNDATDSAMANGRRAGASKLPSQT